MKNYKILENRPELTKEQLTEGLDFNKIKTNAAIAKTAVLKSLIIKSIIAAVVVGAGTFVYKLTTHSVTKSNPITIIDSIKNTIPIAVDSVINIDKKSNKDIADKKNESKKNLIIHSSNSISSIDTSQVIVVSNKMSDPVIVEKEASKTDDKQVADSVINTQNIKINKTKTSKVTRVKSCKIWNTKDFCNIPRTAKFATSLDCDLVDFDYIDCQTANQKNNIIAVWLTIFVNEKSSFQIENDLKNITLIKTNGKSESPLMLYLNGDGKFFGENFKAKKMTVHYNKQFDIFMFFQNAKVGDKIIIHNLIEALIEQ